MAPSTKATRPQEAKRQQKISAFARVTKTAAAATTGHKTYHAKVTAAVQDIEQVDSYRGAGRKRSYDAIGDEETCKLEEQVTTPISKKVRQSYFSSLLLRPAYIL